MLIQPLTGNWQFRKADEEEWYPAQVPGGVHTDLMTCGRIPDPFVADDEKHVQWVAESGWEYRRTFTVDAGLLAEEKVFLACDGLDTLAEVTLNGEEVGKAENMFRSYRWQVKSLLREGENELRIAFASPVRYVIAKMDERPLAGVSQAIPGSPHLRKVPSHFGWDWGPMLPPIGIWKEIRLEGRSVARLDDVHLRQHHVDGEVTVWVRLTVERWEDSSLRATVRVTAPDGTVLEQGATFDGNVQAIEVTIEEPQLWWPNGYGEQPLYEVEVVLSASGDVVDRQSYQLGLRTVELRREADKWGESFTFVVNGVPIFVKGSNWIPADSFPTRLTDEFMEHLIRSTAESNQNMLRVWGGGFYEEERFYDLCDRYGILVWQDFIFSCSIYPLDEDDFLHNVQVEAIENIRRLRHRASLALWCGNNEMEWGWGPPELSQGARAALEELAEQLPFLRRMLSAFDQPPVIPGWQDLKRGYEKFFYSTLPGWVSQEDPDTPYWPSSPSSNTPFRDVNSQERGDAHYWDVWHGRQPFTAYRDQYPRFMSEFGFQSLPTLKTIATYAEQKDWNMTSYIMEHHQRGNHGNGLILAQMTDTFRMPKDFASLVYLSLVLQAEGIRYGVEHWRRNMHRVSGALYWQLNDCWPVASWASIDYFGRWKALHYAAKRFYAPLLLSIEDNRAAMNVHVTSDLTEPWEGTLHWSLETVDGKVLESGEEAVLAKPLADTLVCALDFADREFAQELTPAHAWEIGGGGRALYMYRFTDVEDTGRNVVFVCELRQGGKRVALQVAPFVPTKHLELIDPALQVAVREEGEQLAFDLAAGSLARFVELSLEGVDAVFSDNYFDLPAGRTVTVTCPLPEGWTIERARAALSVRSVYDSFASS
jgi:beta-mannosidase